MNSTIDRRLNNLENALGQHKKFPFLLYFAWKQTEQEALDEWNAINNEHYCAEDFGTIVAVSLSRAC